jgi:hypothetical protein
MIQTCTRACKTLWFDDKFSYPTPPPHPTKRKKKQLKKKRKKRKGTKEATMCRKKCVACFIFIFMVKGAQFW